MKWLDIYDIIPALEETYPEYTEKEILALRFTELHAMVLKLDGFDDESHKSNEKILESIQMNWIQEIS